MWGLCRPQTPTRNCKVRKNPVLTSQAIVEHSRTRTRSDSSTTDLARGLPLGDLLALGTQLRADVTPEALLQEVADAIYSVLGYPQVYIRLRNADTDELEACAFAGVPD